MPPVQSQPQPVAMPSLIPGKPDLPSQLPQPPVFMPDGSVITVDELGEIMRTRRRRSRAERSPEPTSRLAEALLCTPQSKRARPHCVRQRRLVAEGPLQPAKGRGQGPGCRAVRRWPASRRRASDVHPSGQARGRADAEGDVECPCRASHQRGSCKASPPAPQRHSQCPCVHTSCGYAECVRPPCGQRVRPPDGQRI
eukprot:5454823-Alexandrium_andersonii.AAC.1